MSKQCNLPLELSKAFAVINKELDLDNSREFDYFIDLACLETYFHLKCKCPHCKNIKKKK